MISDKEPVVFDLELMGKGDDIFFFFGARHLATGRTIALEGNDTATISKLITLMRNERYLWVSFNGSSSTRRSWPPSWVGARLPK